VRGWNLEVLTLIKKSLFDHLILQRALQEDLYILLSLTASNFFSKFILTFLLGVMARKINFEKMFVYFVYLHFTNIQNYYSLYTFCLKLPRPNS
jgi:uncharacterized membrane protein